MSEPGDDMLESLHLASSFALLAAKHAPGVATNGDVAPTVDGNAEQMNTDRSEKAHLDAAIYAYRAQSTAGTTFAPDSDSVVDVATRTSPAVESSIAPEHMNDDIDVEFAQMEAEIDSVHDVPLGQSASHLSLMFTGGGPGCNGSIPRTHNITLKTTDGSPVHVEPNGTQWVTIRPNADEVAKEAIRSAARSVGADEDAGGCIVTFGDGDIQHFYLFAKTEQEQPQRSANHECESDAEREYNSVVGVMQVTGGDAPQHVVVASSEICQPDPEDSFDYISETSDDCKGSTYYGPLNVVYEPLCDPANLERTLHPIRYPELFAYNKKLEARFWTADKVSYEDDPKDWRDPNKMNALMKRVMLNVLSYFARSEPIVREDAGSGIGDIITDPSARAFFATKAQNENVHDETYNRQIDVLCDTEEEREKVRNAAKDSPVIKNKYDFAKKWLYNESASLAMRIVAFVMVEGLHFSSSFSTILWFKMKGLLPGICEGNDYIIDDEGIHWNYGVGLHNTLQPANRISQDALYAVMDDAVNLECAFAHHLLQEPLPGLLPSMMCEYVKSLACNMVTLLGHDKPYIALNPFPWTETNNLNSKKNFFERRAVEYKRAEYTMNKTETDFDAVKIPAFGKTARAPRVATSIRND